MAKYDYSDSPLRGLRPRRPQSRSSRRLGFLARGFAVLSGALFVGYSVSFAVLSMLPHTTAVSVIGVAVIVLALSGSVWLFDRACGDWVSGDE